MKRTHNDNNNDTHVRELGVGKPNSWWFFCVCVRGKLKNVEKQKL